MKSLDEKTRDRRYAGGPVLLLRYGVEQTMRENFHKRLVAVKTADAINAIKGVPVSADAKLLSEKWVRGELTGEQMKQELLDLRRKIAAEENRSDY